MRGIAGPGYLFSANQGDGAGLFCWRIFRRARCKGNPKMEGMMKMIRPPAHRIRLASLLVMTSIAGGLCASPLFGQSRITLRAAIHSR